MVNWFLLKLCGMTALSGFLFGYDTGIISTSMVFIRDEMKLSTIWIELIVSSTVAFAWLFGWLSAFISNYLGRKSMIILASLKFTLASLIMGLAPEKYCLLIGRAIAGSAIGLGSMIAPIYIAELSPKEKRGSLVTLNTAFVTFGILASTLIASGFSYLPSNIGWRFMLGFACLPSIFQFIGFLYMPESPRYLCLRNKDEEALEVMVKIYKDLDKAKEEVKLIKASFEDQNIQSNDIKKNYYDNNNNNNFELKKSSEESLNSEKEQNYFSKLGAIIRNPSTRHCLILGICLHIGQQFCGINTIMYYGATIIQMSGVLSKRISIWFTVIVGIVNATTSFIALFFYDKVTRRKITILSMGGTVVCLAIMGAMFVKVKNNIIPIFELNDIYTENLDEINYCNQIKTCGGCVADLKCGYCFNSNDIKNTGRCLPRLKSDPLKSLNNTYCSDGSNEDLDIYFTTQYCPSDYGIYTLIVLCLFLIWYAFGMNHAPWSINAELYSMGCRNVAVSFATGFNWLSNLIVSFTFLTITEHFSISGAFFFYMTISAIFTLIYYLWLPETKYKSMEEDTIVFRH